jgi:hypothetical protein
MAQVGGERGRFARRIRLWGSFWLKLVLVQMLVVFQPPKVTKIDLGYFGPPIGIFGMQFRKESRMGFASAENGPAGTSPTAKRFREWFV